jgi:hypothetical protein
MYGSPFAWSCRNPTLLSPGPNFPKESAIKPGAAQVMQKTRDLILMHPLSSMAQRRGHSDAHTRGPHRMMAIVSSNHAPTVNRVRVIVETHQPGQECTGNQGRNMCVDIVHHESACTQANTQQIGPRGEYRSMKRSVKASLRDKAR